MPETSHVLTIVIPALNEEDAIGDTIRRCLEARSHIIGSSPVDEVEVIVVSDGSTDRTEEIAKSFEEVKVLVFEVNRGYGAAIKCGWQHGRGDLLAFLDGDGTCDPNFFADLCTALEERGADIALGSRMGPDSGMPFIRTVGNALFAWLLGALSKQRVKDTASGMRVVRRACLGDLYPLPDGLHFTPAMSAQVLIGDELTLIELPVPYAERTGESKLGVLKDGVGFLMAILRAAVTFRPARLLLLIAGFVGLGALALGSGPWLHWLREARLAEWEIHRILAASLLATVSAVFVCSAVIADRIAATAHGRPPSTSGVTGMAAKLFSPRMRLVGSTALLAAAVVIVWPGIAEFLTTGAVEMHWSRAMLASLLVVIAAMLVATIFLLNMMTLIEAEGAVAVAQRPPERIHLPRSGNGD
jgi:hypothetical protein